MVALPHRQSTHVWLGLLSNTMRHWILDASESYAIRLLKPFGLIMNFFR